MSVPTYPSSCITVNEVVFTSDFMPDGLGLAQQLQYRYEFRVAPLYGLNKLDILLVYSRPSGQGSLAHVLTSGSKPFVLQPCKKGSLKISGGVSGVKLHLQDTYLIRAEGRLTTENFVYIDIITFLFFNYTNNF